MNLRTILLLLFSIIISFNTFGQKDEIHGNWRPFAIDNGEFYMNSQTDSISLYKEFDYIRNDSLKLIEFREVVNQIYFSQTHTFTENGKYIQDLTIMKLQLDYKIDKTRNIILASENNFEDEKGTQELPYWLKNDILYFEIPLTEPPVKLWLKK